MVVCRSYELLLRLPCSEHLNFHGDVDLISEEIIHSYNAFSEHYLTRESTA